MDKLKDFRRFQRKKNEELLDNIITWCYTRISTKDQSKHSLTNQLKKIKEYAKENGYKLTEKFGGTFESASKDDERKEFTRLLKEVKETKIKPKVIIINTVNRFSRTGGGAIAIALKIIEEYGVNIIEVTTGANTLTERDTLNFYHELLKAREQNLDRLDITLPAMKLYLEEGSWLGKAPFGYDNYGPRVKDMSKVRGEQKIILNADGEKLRKAWFWKLEGYSDSDILKKLKLIGVKLSKSTVSAMWRKPFYCGVNTNAMLEEPVNGKWEKMITEEHFLAIQDVLDKNNQGYKVNRKHTERPLTGYAFCKCGTKMKSYKASKREVHYYACTKCKGTTINANTSKRYNKKGLHELYSELLLGFQIPKEAIEPIIIQLEKIIKYRVHNDEEEKKQLKIRLKVIDERFDELEELALNKTFDKNTYIKHSNKLNIEKSELEEKIKIVNPKSSNIRKQLKGNLKLAQNLSEYWKNGSYLTKTSLQKLVFPNGIEVDSKNRGIRTKSTNTFFDSARSLSMCYDSQKKGLSKNKLEKSDVVAGTGLEPVTFGL